MQEQSIEIDTGVVALSGTLSLPDETKPRAAVLFLHGSGPLDRDENMPGQRLDVFNTLARHFATLAIAGFRYDKRGCGRSGGEYEIAGQDDFKADAAACIQYLHNALPGVRLFLVGHSEGTLLAARLSLEHDVDGLVLLSPFLSNVEDLLMMQARSLEDMLRETRGLAGALNRVAMALGLAPTASQRRLIKKLKSTTDPRFRRAFGPPIEARSLRDLLSINPRAVYAQVLKPMLLITGEKDLQCDPRDAERIAMIVGQTATAVTLPDLTHVLRRDTGPHSFASYPKLLAQPIDQEVVRLAGDWLAAR